MGAAPASGKRSAERAGMHSSSTPGTHTMARQKPRVADSNEEPRTSVAEQHESDGSTSARGSTEDVVLQPDYPRVRDLEAAPAGTASTSSSEHVVTSGSTSAQQQPEEAAAAAELIPTAASLLVRARRMFLGGPAGPTASGSDEAAVQVTKGLVLFGAEAIRELFFSQREAIELACGVLDEREALAHLIGDAAGVGLLPAEAARKMGDKAGKLVWVKKGQSPIEADLADARRAVQRRKGKLPEGASLEAAFDDARTAVLRESPKLTLPSREECEAAERARVRAREREQAAAARAPQPPPPPPPERDPRLVALDRAPSVLELPPTKPPSPKPPSAAGGECAEPPPPDRMRQRFEAWCRRHDPGGVADPVAYYEHQRKCSRLMRAVTARRWKPRTWAERRDRAQTLSRQQRSNQLCECDDDVPSILCRAHACYAFEIGMCDGLPEPSSVAQDPASRISCNCMRHVWGVDQEQRWPAHKPPLMIEATEDYDFLTEQTTRFLYFAWLDPMPGGQYGPGFDPEAAARKLTVMDMHPGASERYGFSCEKFPSFGKV